MGNYIDKTLKIISGLHLEWIQKLIFQDNKEVVSLNSFRLEINLPEKRIDDAFEVTLTKGEKKYLFIEFLFGQDRRQFKTYFVKTAMATDIYGPGRVATIVIQITEGPQKAIKPVYETELDGIKNTFTMQLLYLNSYLDDIEKGRLYEFAPLIPLMRGRADEKVLTNVKKLIEKEKDTKKRSELYSSAITIAGRYLNKDFLWNFFKEELEMIQDSPIVQEWIEQGFDKGREEGKEEGREEGSLSTAREILFEAIEKRFGLIKQKMVQDIKKIQSREVLRYLHRQSLRVTNIDDFYGIVKIAKENSQS